MVKYTETEERFYYYIDAELNELSMSDREFFNYPNQPVFAPVFAYENDTDVDYNNLKNSVFQFAYRYVFADGRRSLYSPYSEIALTSSGEDLYGEALDSLQVSNKLVITVYAPLFRNELAYIEVIFRRAMASGWGEWLRAGSIDSDYILKNKVLKLNFYNDVALQAVDQIEVAVSYNILPIKADAQATLLNNRISYGGITEGYDIIHPDIKLTPEFIELDIGYTGDKDGEYEIIDYSWGTQTFYIEYFKIIKIDAVPDNGKVIVFYIDNTVLSYVISGGPNITKVKSDIVKVLKGAGYYAFDDQGFETYYPNVTIGYDSVLVMSGYYDASYGFAKSYIDKIDVYLYSSVEAVFSKIGGFKTGATHRLCLIYYDELMRAGEAISGDNLSVYLPFITKQTISKAGAIYKYNINWEISHVPPSWAKYWRFGYAGNTSISYFVQYSVEDVNNDATGFTQLNITPLQTIPSAEGSDYLSVPLVNSNIKPYEFNKGDRVRFITPKSNGSTIQSPLDATADDTNYDYEILEYGQSEGGEGFYIKIQEITLGSGSGEVDMGAGSIIEIYRPKKKTEDVVYYEYGELFRVLEDNGLLYHEGQTQDQTYDEYGAIDEPAKGVLSKGDIYHLLRLFSFDITSDSQPYPVESYSASDFYDSEVWGKGRINLDTKIGQKKLNNIRYSLPLIQDTKINGLSTFEYDKVITINRKYGEITGMREVGHTLKVLQQSNNTGVNVGRVEYDDTTGVRTVLTSDKILGSQRTATSGYGCINPESIIKIGSSLYWFDAMRECMVRDAGNGAFPISGKHVSIEGTFDYKMEKYFRHQAKGVRERGVKVFSAWDNENKLLYVYFKQPERKHGFKINRGYVYNGYAIHDVRGLAPEGWRIPSLRDWQILMKYIDPRYDFSQSISDIPFGELADNSDGAWKYAEYSPVLEKENATGFSVLANQTRGASFDTFTWMAYFWTSEGDINSDGMAIRFNFGQWIELSKMYNTELMAGLNIRMVKDDATSWKEGDLVFDLDGNAYNTVKIGSQVWTVQNWASTKYSNGDSIENIIDDEDWYNATEGAYSENPVKMYSAFTDIPNDDAARYGGYYYENYKDGVYRKHDKYLTGDECVVFHEPSNRWVGILSIYGLNYIDSGSNNLVSYINDRLLAHNHKESLRATFDNETYGAGTWVFSSENNNVNKIFHAIAVHASEKPHIDDVRVYNEEVKGGWMFSRIYQKAIKKIEGVFRAAFLRNSKSDKIRLFNSDFLRGKVLKAEISYDKDTDKEKIQSGIEIYKVDLECEISEF